MLVVLCIMPLYAEEATIKATARRLAKSVHMTFVHSCGNLGLLLSGYVLDSRRDLRGIIEMGEPVLPWAILVHMTLYILHQIAEAFPLVIPCALIVDLAKHPLNGVSTRTVRR